MDYSALASLLFLGLPVAVVSVTLVRGKIFERQRAWVSEHSQWFGKLLSCVYCTSHWVALGATLAFRPTPVASGVWVVDLLCSAFAVVAVAVPVGGLLYVSIERLSYLEEDNLREGLRQARRVIVDQSAQIEKLTTSKNSWRDQLNQG